MRTGWMAAIYLLLTAVISLEFYSRTLQCAMGYPFGRVANSSLCAFQTLGDGKGALPVALYRPRAFGNKPPPRCSAVRFQRSCVLALFRIS